MSLAPSEDKMNGRYLTRVAQDLTDSSKEEAKVPVPHTWTIFPANQHAAVTENQGKLSYIIAFTSVLKWLTAFIFSLWHLQIMRYLGTGISTAWACQEYYHWRLSKNIAIAHNTSTSSKRQNTARCWSHGCWNHMGELVSLKRIIMVVMYLFSHSGSWVLILQIRASSPQNLKTRLPFSFWNLHNFLQTRLKKCLKCCEELSEPRKGSVLPDGETRWAPGTGTLSEQAVLPCSRENVLNTEEVYTK